MADETEKDSPKRSPINRQTIWFALPALAIVAFFVWVLSEMGGQSSGLTLGRMLLGIAVVLGGGAALAFVLMRRGSRG